MGILYLNTYIPNIPLFASREIVAGAEGNTNTD